MNQKKKGIDLNKDPKKLLTIAIENRKKIAIQKTTKQSDAPPVNTTVTNATTSKPKEQAAASKPTVSIKQMLQQKNATQQTVSASVTSSKAENKTHSNTETLELNIENIKLQFSRFIEQKSKSDRLKVDLLVGEPQLNNSQITLKTTNQLQYNDLSEVATELQNYLQRVFSNPELRISIMQPDQTPTKKIFNNTDRFNQMCEKNPLLLQMKKQFLLDFD